MGDDPLASDATSAETQPVQPGSVASQHHTWGRYRLDRRLGSGSFGSVYSAWDPDLERTIAIKILHQDVADSRLREQLLREGRALARVQHANVVPVFGTEVHGNRVGLCMEYVAGETLADVLRRHGRFSPREASLVAEDVCRALAAVHAAGYVHRDVKAHNVMRGAGGKIVLMDFGTGFDTARSDAGHDVAGTPIYMAPEILEGGQATPQSDIYAVGVLLYHLVTGGYPVEGNSVAELIDAHSSGRRRLVIEAEPSVPVPFAQVISRALTPDPKERWPSAAAMLEALVPSTPNERRGLRTLFRAMTFALGVLLALTMFGIVSTRYFDIVLTREAFSEEGASDWLGWGAKSMVAPTLLALMALAGLAIFRGVLRLIARLNVAHRPLRMFDGLGVKDVETMSELALLASVAVIGASVWLQRDALQSLLALIGDTVSSAPPERLEYLSPRHFARHESYRITFSWAAIALTVLWSIPLLIAVQRNQAVHGMMKLAAAGLMLLAFVLLHLPYRMFYHAADMEVVQWRGEKCYAVGASETEHLVFCPLVDPPRSHIVRKDSSELSFQGIRANPFSDLPPPPSGQ